MQKKITFRNMEKTQPMEEYCYQQLAKVEEFLSNERTPIFIDLVLEPSKIHAHHRIELRVKSPRFDKISNYEGPQFYDVLDRVIDVMYRELQEASRKEHDLYKARGRHEEVKKQK